MKKIIFLLCVCVLFSSPVFSAENASKSSVKDEVKRVKLEAKQKVEKIKTEAKAAKIKAREDAKQAKIDAKNAEINAVLEAKRAKKEAEFNSKLEEIISKNDAKKAELNAVAKEKKDKIDLELNAKISAVEEKNNSEISALRAKYGKDDTIKTVEKNTENKTETSHIKPVSNTEDTDEAENRVLKTSDLKPRASEKKSAAAEKNAPVYTGINFETKKQEIEDELKLTEKQKANAEKIYAKNKDEIALLNVEIENKLKEIKTLKKTNMDTNSKARRLSALQEELNSLYQERDSVHNDAMRKFDGILNREQEAIWLDIKNGGARLFPDIEQIR